MMDTPSIPSLFERDESKPVPKIFMDSHSYDQSSNSKTPEVEKSTSFIQKIMTNARSMLGTRCNSLHPSTCSEEPTRETDNCNRYIEVQGKVFRDTGPTKLKTKLKYTPSDYCMGDEDSISKEDTTTTETLPQESSRSTRENVIPSSYCSSSRKNSGGYTSYTYSETSNKDTCSSKNTSEKEKRSNSLPCGCMRSINPNGPFEPSEFFVSLDDQNTNVVSQGFSKKYDVESLGKGEKGSFSAKNSWIRTNKTEKNEVKKTDSNIPCKDNCFNNHLTSSTILPIIRHISRGNQAFSHIEGTPKDGKDTPSTNDEEDEEEIPTVFPKQEGSSTRDLPCYTCGLKRKVVSRPSPAPSVGDDIWPTGSGKVKTIYCESERYPSKIIVCGDESNEEVYKSSAEVESITDYKSKNTPSTDNEIERKMNEDKPIEKRPDAVAKKVRSISECKDQDNQCAFIGSPILQSSNFRSPSLEKKTVDVNCSMDENYDKFEDMISEVNNKERGFHSQIQGIKTKEKQYDSMFDYLQGEIAKCRNIDRNDDELDRITKELKNENKVLKSEVMEMKLDLKHTLEKVQGPMRLKLETEKVRCEQLQNELQKTSQNMAVSQENYIREMNNLKMQLCMACSNISELENVNRKLKEEMTLMDGMCGKLEDDLMQQKINEAETIRRLMSNRRNMGESHSIMLYNCESNLHDVARKLSKTIKECIPCSTCATGLPAELKGAAKLIKDLTDMVESRKDNKSIESLPPSRTDTSCQSPPYTEENSTQCMDLRNIGTVVSMCLVSPTSPTCAANRFKATKTLYAGAHKFVDKDASSQFNIKLLSCKSGPNQVESRYFSAEPTPNSSGIRAKMEGKSPVMRDNHTDPKMLDKQISSGHVHFEWNSDERYYRPDTKDGLNDPMVEYKSGDHQKTLSNKEGDPHTMKSTELCTQFAKKIVFEINTALINSSFKDNKNKEPKAGSSRPVSPKTENIKPEITDVDIETICELKVTPKSSTPKILEKKELSDYKPVEGPWLDERSGKLLPDALINLGLPLCNKSSRVNTVQFSCCKQKTSYNSTCDKKECPRRTSADPKNMCQPVKMCHPKAPIRQEPCNDTCPGKKKPLELKVKTGEGKSPVELSRGAQGAVAENVSFPFQVDTQVDILDEPPEGLNITTCVTDSGNLNVITEGPAGTIETVLHYKDDGTIEVITQITELDTDTSTSASASSKQVETLRHKSSSCHALCPGASKSCAANKFMEQKMGVKSGEFGPPCMKIKRSKSDINVCVCPSKDKLKLSKSLSQVCKKISQISAKASAKASAIIQVMDPRNWTRNMGTSTTKVNVDTSQSCSFLRQHRAMNTQAVGQISATTSEATKKASVMFDTSQIVTRDVICGGSASPCTQQTLPVECCQKSTGEECTKATCSSLTTPISTSCKCEDTYQGAAELRSDEEVSCSSEICHRETCTDTPKKVDAITYSGSSSKLDQCCMCDCPVGGNTSKEASVCQALENSCQSAPQPSEQSCQCNESKEIGVSTMVQNEEVMAINKEAVCGKPPCGTPCSVPCSPCHSSTKPQSVCPSVCSKPVGDTVIEEFHSAADLPKEGICTLCTCGNELKCTCEVPTSVPPCESMDTPKKKRPGLLSNLECLCPGPCNCVICAPNVLEDRVKQTGTMKPQDDKCQICCLGQGSKPKEEAKHPKDCICPVCCCEKEAACQKQFAVFNVTATPKPEDCSATCATGFDEKYLACMNLECGANRAMMGPLACAANRATKVSIDDIFKKNPQSVAQCGGGKPTQRHPESCECIDCICMPVVRQLAMTKEFPIVKHEKQVYQVTTICQCPNTKKGSKIPVATKGGGKPGGKGLACNCTGPCTCTPCADPDKKKGPAKKEDVKVKRMTPEQLAALCDCGKCDCPICAVKKNKMKGTCCCTPDCICDSCKIELMKKQIDKLKSEVKELKGISDPPDLGHPAGCDCGICNCPLPPGDDPRRDQPPDCDCLICDCPLAPGKGGDMSGCTCLDCDCPKGPKFQKPKVKKPIDLSGCSCNPCKCPGGPLSAFPKCDCKVCECDPCSDPRKPKKITCDCEPCECSPCGDPKRQAKKWRPKECECKDCRCSGLKDRADDCTCVKCLCDAHPPNCTCSKCVCGDTHPPGCNCPICTCGEKAVDHPPGCQCDKCKCPGPAKPCPAEEEAKKRLAEFLKKSVSTHAIDCKCATCQCFSKAAGGALMCTCNPCKCTECIFDRQKVMGPHPPGCKCIICKCKDCDGGAGGAAGALAGATCKCTDCKCKPCTHKGGGGTEQKRAPDCKCGVCNCKGCDTGGGDKKKQAGDVKAVKSAPALPKNRSCHCIECFCDVCNNPAKKGASARPDIVIKGAGKKTVAAGPSAASIKKAPTPSGDHPQDCKCGTCLCKECSYGAKHGPNCKCTACICKECGTGMPPPPPPKVASKSTTDCSCKPCACRECDKKTKGPGCKCAKCGCKPCEGKPEKKDAACHCATCKCKECAGGSSPPPFSQPHTKSCDCKQCKCQICKAKGSSTGGFQAPKAVSCQCKKCDCTICNKAGGGGGQKVSSGSSTSGFQVPKREECHCKQCTCPICSKQAGDSKAGCGGLALRGGGAPCIPSTKEAPPFEIPSRMPCLCNPCKCIMCNKQGGKKDGVISARPSTTAAGVQCKCPKDKDLSLSVNSACDCPICSCPSYSSSIHPGKDEPDAPDCDCSLCRCTPCADPKITQSRISAKVGDSVSTHSAKVGITTNKHSRSTSCICTPLRNAKVGESENRFGTCESIELSVMNLSAMDNATLMKTIQDNAKENTVCKNEIQEITQALSNIKSACSEVEEKAMKAPLIKQASAFGQTMSGLKLALNNLQDKCKAKDLLIEAMTGELKNRTSSNTFLQVLETCVISDAPDYDKAADIIPKNYEEKKLKAIEGERIIRRRRGSKTCKCGKQHKDKDYKNVDVTGFEVVDIRRITHDSIIIKWKPPKSGPITGYDIFINGVNKSKVMSGGRTSAMVHSIDLSATIQITIYAVTKCGRCEPPAIAIYEIRT